MRQFLLLLVLGACGDPSLAKPDPAELQKLSYEAQCDAVGPRTARCANELMIADVESLTGRDDPDGRAIVQDLQRDNYLSADQARAIAKQSCLGSATQTFPTRALVCWDEPDCARFVACMTR